MFFLNFTWNPIEGIDLGFFIIRFYSLSYVIAFILGWYIIKKFFVNEKVSLDKMDSLFMYMVLAVLIGARLGHVLFYETSLLWTDPLAVFLPFRTQPEFEMTGFRGLASHGAAIGIIIALLLWNRRKLKMPALWIFDRIVITVAIGGAFVRLGNFMNSEIVGKVVNASFPMGVRLVRNDIHPETALRATGMKDVNDAYTAIVHNPEFSNLLETVPYRHPSQLYEALGYVITFLVCWYIYWKTDKKEQVGYIFGWFLILLFTTRFIVEFFKEAQLDERAEWFLNTGQLLSVPFILAGVYLLFSSKRQNA